MQQDRPTNALPQNLRFLCVDDTEANLLMMTWLLEGYDFKDFEAVSSGAKALALVNNGQRFDVGLIDIKMPVMDGFGLLRALRAHPDAAVREMPLIAVTAQALPGDREKCLLAGFYGYLSKPINPITFTQSVAAIRSLHKQDKQLAS